MFLGGKDEPRLGEFLEKILSLGDLTVKDFDERSASRCSKTLTFKFSDFE